MVSLTLSCPLKAADTHGTVCSTDPSSALVFVGTLTDLTSANYSPQWSSATFHVTELLQGESSDEVSASMQSNLCHDSGTIPAVGGTYLVLAHSLRKASSRSLIQLEHCEQIRPVDQSTAELAYLRSSQAGNTATEVAGEISVDTRGYPWKKVLLPETKIHLIGSNQRFDFVSDHDGQFHGIIIPGQYAVTVEFPAGYEAEYSGQSTIIAIRHRCTQLTVGASPTASITAHIVDTDGNPLGPMSNVELTLETAEDQQFVQSVWPNENSDLEAKNLLPGKYILGLNTFLPVTRGSAPYPHIHFPGVAARSDARIITLDAGEQKVLPEMRIKKGQSCEIPVRVVDGFGKPSESAAVGFAYGDYPNLYIEPQEQTDKNGREAVYVVFPGPIFLRAKKQREDGSTSESEIFQVSSCPGEAVSLKLSRVVVAQPAPAQK